MEKRDFKYAVLILQQLGREVAEGIIKGTEQVAGQLQMELPEAHKEASLENYLKKKEKYPDLSFEEYLRLVGFDEPKDPDMTKLMRCIAKMSDRIVKKLDVLIDVLKGGGIHE